MNNQNNNTNFNHLFLSGCYTPDNMPQTPPWNKTYLSLLKQINELKEQNQLLKQELDENKNIVEYTKNVFLPNIKEIVDIDKPKSRNTISIIIFIILITVPFYLLFFV